MPRKKDKPANVQIKTTSMVLNNLPDKDKEHLRKLCYHAARLYNVALYNVKQYRRFYTSVTDTLNGFPVYAQIEDYILPETAEYVNEQLNAFYHVGQPLKPGLNAYRNYHLVKANHNYKILPGQTGMTALNKLDDNYKSFFALLKTCPEMRPRPPKYIAKDFHGTIYFPKQVISKPKDSENTINLPLSRVMKAEGYTTITLTLPPYIDRTRINEVRIMPYPKKTAKNLKAFIAYETDKQTNVWDYERYLSIDMGLDNLATCVDVQGGHNFIICGRWLKSVNQWWNKESSRLKSIRDIQNNAAKSIRYDTYKLNQIQQKRNARVTDYMHKAAQHIVNYCMTNNVGNIVVGWNPEMKQRMELGKKTNQAFTQIPFAKLRQNIKTRCDEHGLRYAENEESYTSKCSYLDGEEVCKHGAYKGRRVKRGLFRTSTGQTINADVNGALNIYRKVTEDYSAPTESQTKGCLSNPVRIKIYEYNERRGDENKAI